MIDLAWRPIATAPKDGTVFLAFAPGADYGLDDLKTHCSWHRDAGFCVCELREPTHWLPFSEIPSPNAPAP